MFIYTIDRDDVIIHVSRNWRDFAQENDADEACAPGAVVGRPLWQFIAGIETRHLYEQLFERTRAGRNVGPVPFRCDAPELRRRMQLFLSPVRGGGIMLRTVLLRAEGRSPVRLLDIRAPRSAEILHLCSMCKKLQTRPGRWTELEDGIAELNLFAARDLPQLSHGLCPRCGERMIQEMDALDAAGA